MKHRMGKTTQGSIALEVLEKYKKNGTEKLDLRSLNKQIRNDGLLTVLVLVE